MPDDAPTHGSGKLLFVANTDWYLFNFRLNLLRAARAKGWHVVLACPYHEHAKALEAEGFTVYPVAFDTVGIHPARELAALRALRRVIKTSGAQVIHLFTLKCVLYGALTVPARGVITIGAITGMGHLFTTDSWRTRLLKTPVLQGLKLAFRRGRPRLIFQNTADRDEFVALRLIDASRTHVIRGSGVDCQRFSPAPDQSGDAPVRLLFCGRLIAEKGIREYLAATAKLKNRGYTFESRIAGAPYPGNPSSLSDAEIVQLENDGQHVLLGQHADMAGLFAATDIVVLPTYREGTPKALLEAAASGCQIVTTDIPGCQGIIEPGVNGELVAPRQIEPLVAALQRMLETPVQTRHQMREASRRIAVERFSDVEVNAKTLALYRT